MRGYRRYAIYYAPEAGPLADFGAHWLGWDAVTGQSLDHPDIPRLPRDIDEMTSAPRKYGFHGTLKPPFVLSGEAEALRRSILTLAERLPPACCEGLKLARMGRVMALVPRGDEDELTELAADVVRALDPHRATDEGGAVHRHPAGLSPRQAELQQLWGFPFVMEEFRFHMTLTGRLTVDESELVEMALAPRLEPILPRPFEIRDLCLFGEARDGRFHLIERFPLRG